jgi:hypothetical protein
VSHELSQLLAEERFLPFVEQQRIEFAPTRTLYNRGLSASPNLQIVAAFIAETRALLDKESTVTAIQYTAVPDLKIVSIPLLIDVDDVDRREDMMDYLDFVLDRGSLLAGRPSHRALGGICHLNWKVKPRYLLVFGPRARLYYSEIAYAVAHYNFFQAGLEEEPWPSVASEQFPAYRPRTISGRL